MSEVFELPCTPASEMSRLKRENLRLVQNARQMKLIAAACLLCAILATLIGLMALAPINYDVGQLRKGHEELRHEVYLLARKVKQLDAYIHAIHPPEVIEMEDGCAH